MTGFLDAPLMVSSGGYQVQRSVRLRSAASASLSRTPSSAGNRKLLSGRYRIKRGALGSVQVIASAGTTSIDRLYFNASDQLCLDVLGTLRLATTPVYRDPSSWYVDVEFRLDVANGTAANRAKLLIDGVEVAAYSTDTRSSISNTDTNWNNTVVHYLGRDNAGNHFDGYLAEPIGVDGGIASAYSNLDATINQRVPVRPSATYGTNGFYLDFSDITSTTTLGYDKSGNSNHWTTNNISLTSGVTYDSMLDVPGLPWADGGNGRGNYCTLNPIDTLVGAPNSANLAITTPSATLRSISSTMGLTGGKWYWETLYGGGGSNALTVGVCGPQHSAAQYLGYLGQSSDSWAYLGATGEKYTNNVATAFGATFTTNDVIGVAYDADTGKIWFSKNGAWQASGDPAAGTNAAYTGLPAGCRPAYGSGTSGAGQTFNSNFGQRPFAYTPPTGFKALNTANLPDPTGAAAKPWEHFDALPYLGNNSSSNTVTGLNFKPDLTWIKNRAAASQHVLTDSVRGVDRQLFSSLTNAEQTSTTGITAFNSNGFSLGLNVSPTGDTNSANNFISWNWKAGGTAVSNTAGSITSQVSANTAAGFSVVTYTGNGVAGATVGHGLGRAPAMVIVKRRSTTGIWAVGHTSLTGGFVRYVDLSGTGAQLAATSVWNDTNPTSTVFSVGTDTATNGSASTYVAYCFAEVPGFSRIGSYTGNGSADGPFVFCGFRPRWVMVKRVDSTENWQVYDTARDAANVSNAQLLPNLSNAEASGGTYLDYLSNGFKLRNVANGGNSSGGTYIYAAFAESPFKYANAR